MNIHRLLERVQEVLNNTGHPFIAAGLAILLLLIYIATVFWLAFMITLLLIR